MSGENAGFLLLPVRPVRKGLVASREHALIMVFEHIEKLQREWTDKYVVVDESRPELRRFRGLTGTVKTVNFSGRALVQFDGYNNIGWYDIDPAWLKIVDAPLPKPEAGKKPAKAEAKPKAAPAAEAKKPAPKAAGMSVAEMLAAARAGKSGGTTPAPAASAPAPAAGEKKLSTAEILAAARSKPGPAPSESHTEAAQPAAAATPAAQPAAKPDPKKMSVAEILAAARAEKSGAAPAAAAAPPPAAKAPEPPAPPEPEPVAEAPAEEEEAAEEVSAPAPAAGGGAPPKLDRSTMSVAEMIAYCRKVDGQ